MTLLPRDLSSQGQLRRRRTKETAPTNRPGGKASQGKETKSLNLAMRCFAWARAVERAQKRRPNLQVPKTLA